MALGPRLRSERRSAQDAEERINSRRVVRSDERTREARRTPLSSHRPSGRWRDSLRTDCGLTPVILAMTASMSPAATGPSAIVSRGSHSDPPHIIIIGSRQFFRSRSQGGITGIGRLGFPIERSASVRGAMAPSEPSATTMSGRPARRRPGLRRGVTTRSIGSTNRPPDRPSVPRLSRRRANACRQPRPAAPREAGGT